MIKKITKKATKQPYSFFSPTFLLCTIVGLGKLPIMPGTIGALIAALEFSFYINLIKSVTPYLLYLLIILPIFTYCIYCYCKNTGNKDPKEVIIDEYYGQYIAQLFSYTMCMGFLIHQTLLYLLIFLSFIFFRIFDIVKPWLVGYCDKNIKNAFGVMLDDIIAGFMAGICSTITIYIIYTIYYL